jgi:mRNA interferase MazF
MTAFRRGDVVLVGFPFTDLAAIKMRPALVVSSDEFNERGQDMILAAITSQVTKKISSPDHFLPAEDQRQAGLPKPSLVKLGRISAPTLSLLTLKLHKVLQ